MFHFLLPPFVCFPAPSNPDLYSISSFLLLFLNVYQTLFVRLSVVFRVPVLVLCVSPSSSVLYEVLICLFL